MGVEVDILFNLERHKRIDVSRQKCESVIGTQRFYIGKFIGSSSGAETEVFKNAEGSVGRETVDIHFARLLYNMVRIVILVDCNGDSVGGVCNLSYGVYDKSVVTLAVVRGYNIQSVTYIEKCRKVVLIGG